MLFTWQHTENRHEQKAFQKSSWTLANVCIHCTVRTQYTIGIGKERQHVRSCALESRIFCVNRKQKTRAHSWAGEIICTKLHFSETSLTIFYLLELGEKCISYYVQLHYLHLMQVFCFYKHSSKNTWTIYENRYTTNCKLIHIWVPDWK